MKLWKTALVFMIPGLLYAGFWAYHNRSEAVFERIVQQGGYTVSLIKERIAAEFVLRPEWGDRKQSRTS